MNEVELAEAVVKATSPSFAAADREFVSSDLAAGEFLCAIDDALYAAARAGQQVPADLLHQVRAFAEGTSLQDRIQGHIDQLLVLAS